MDFSSVRIVLVAITHPGNIGSTARAMKTMGVSRLYLVTPKFFPHKQANELAAGADDILAQCVVTDSLAEALKDCQLVIATSARARTLALPALTATEYAELVCSQPNNIQVAIVFGREHAGLTNDELLRCHYQVTIPTVPDFSSLNIAQAVQIMVYELYKCKLTSKNIKMVSYNKNIATCEEVEQFYSHLTKVMIAVNFLKPDHPKHVQQRIRRLFNRAHLESDEINILRGILSHVQQFLISKET